MYPPAPMGARKAALLTMTKMALVDGSISEEERAMLAPLLGAGETVDALVGEASQTPVSELVTKLDRYADRFFVALRAASMAAVDARLDAREEALYAELVGALGITPADRAIIEQAVAALDAVDPPPPHPRIAQLFQASSFV
jgi:uncharacterized membrane protein YebE (DUF533 family)